MKAKKIVHVFLGIVQNKKGEVLFSNRSEEELPKVHGKWELPGGKVEFGETPAEAVEREVFEETGYRVKTKYLIPKPFVSQWEYPRFIQHTIIMCFVCDLLSDSSVARNDHLVNEAKWLSLEEIQKYSLLPGVLHFISQIKKYS